MKSKVDMVGEEKTEVVRSEKEAAKTQEPEQKKPEKAEKKVTAKKENTIYIGPTITGVVKKFTEFQDGEITAAAREKVNDFPAMERLFVPVSEMPAAVKELSGKSALASIYAQTAQKYNKK